MIHQYTCSLSNYIIEYLLCLVPFTFLESLAWLTLGLDRIMLFTEVWL